MTLYPIAKINLGLNVVALRQDGYHDLETVFWPVTEIHDELTVEVASNLQHGSWTLETSDILGPEEKNLVVKAYNLLREDFNLPAVNIHLKKMLPTQAGMGGGSSDGAYMIRALNELFKLNLTIVQMQQYAARLGADCAFFIESKTAYATGIGDKLTLMDNEKSIMKDSFSLVLVKPDISVSTKEAYAGINPKKPERNCKDIILNEPIERWRDFLHNDFEDSIFPKYPVLQEIKEKLYADGAIYASMSGSGSTIYGIFEKDSFNIQPSTSNLQPSTFNSHYAKYYHKILTF